VTVNFIMNLIGRNNASQRIKAVVHKLT